MLIALLMSALAGLSTGVGGLLGLYRKPGPRTTAVSMGFAAGVMMTVSLADMVPGALDNFRQRMTPAAAGLAGTSLLLLGIASALLFERLLPEEQAFSAGPGQDRRQAMRCALTVGLALLLHNLPEGVLTLFSGAQDPRLGLRMALAVALHNIPEGLSVAVPLYYATGSRLKSAAAAFLSGLAEPLGGVLAYLAAGDALTLDLLQGMLFFIAGIMSCVSISQLLPAGFLLAKRKWTVAGFALGMGTMLVGIAALA